MTQPEQSREQIGRYVAADASVTSSKPWELTVTSPVLRIYAIVAVIIVMAFHIFMAWAVAARESTGAAVTTVDQWSFVGVGLVISALALTMLRPRVRVNSEGVEVRNFLGTRFYPWDLVYGLSFPKGQRWARLELPDFEFVPLWAFQAKDKDIVAKVNSFRELEDRYMPED